MSLWHPTRILKKRYKNIPRVNRIQQMANIQHVFYYSANNDRTEQPLAAKSRANAEIIALVSKNVNEFRIQSTCSENALIKRI